MVVKWSRFFEKLALHICEIDTWCWDCSSSQWFFWSNPRTWAHWCRCLCGKHFKEEWLKIHKVRTVCSLIYKMIYWEQLVWMSNIYWCYINTLQNIWAQEGLLATLVGGTLVKVKGSRVWLVCNVHFLKPCMPCVEHTYKKGCVLVREHAYYNTHCIMSIMHFFTMQFKSNYIYLTQVHPIFYKARHCSAWPQTIYAFSDRILTFLNLGGNFVIKIYALQ